MKIKYYKAQDNPMFPPQITMLIRFARPVKAVACALCGKKRKKMWTMLVPFRAQSMAPFALIAGDELPALTLVCEDHPLAPLFIELALAIDGPRKESKIDKN